MSRYGWEHGTIKLPTSEVARVKKTVRDANNTLHEQRYQLARTIWRKHGRKLKTAAVKDHGWHFGDAKQKAIDAEMRGRFESSDGYEILHEVLNTAVAKGRAPKREDVHPQRATTKTVRFGVGFYDEATITFKGREVTWSVAENNHSVERAREDPVAIAFFKALGRVKWTRGSGGTIVGNDEYNRDSYSAFGGGNYVTAEYGPSRTRRY